MMRRYFPSVLATAALTILCVAFTAVTAGAQEVVGVTTVPMRLELNRPYIDVTLKGPNGHGLKATAYVDTGGGALILSAGLAKRLGLESTGKIHHSQGLALAPTTVPALRIGDKAITLVDAAALISTNEPATLGHTDAEVGLPGRYLRHYMVVFDYPAHTFTIADPDKLKPEGVAVRANIGESGMPVVWASVAGKSYGFLLDTGGQYCMISNAEMKAWAKQNPGWPRTTGAYGPANMLLGKSETKIPMLRIAALQWGPFRIGNAGAVSRGIGNYEHFMSGIVGTPIIGSIGGNVLRNFRVSVDYPARKVFLSGNATVLGPSIDMVGITLEPAAQGGYQVAGISTGMEGIKVGDRLLKVDGHDVAQAPFSRVVERLGGVPGTMHALVLQRGNEKRTVHEKARSIFR